MRSCKPDPLAADIVHVGEDRRNGADLAGWFGSPGGRGEMFDKKLVDAIIGGKDLDCGSAELSESTRVKHRSQVVLITREARVGDRESSRPRLD